MKASPGLHIPPESTHQDDNEREKKGWGNSALFSAGDLVFYKKTNENATILQLNPIEGTAVVRLASGKTKKTKLKNLVMRTGSPKQDEPKEEDVVENMPLDMLDNVPDEMPMLSPGASRAQQLRDEEEAYQARLEQEAAAIKIQSAARARQARVRVGKMSKEDWEARYGKGKLSMEGFKAADVDGDGEVDRAELAQVMREHHGDARNVDNDDDDDDDDNNQYHQEVGYSNQGDYDQYDDPYGGFGRNDEFQVNEEAAMPTQHGGLGESLPSLSIPSPLQDQGGGHDDDFMAEYEEEGSSVPALSPGMLSHQEMLASALSQEVEKSETPLMFMNDDGEEFELRTPSPCDSIAQSDYHYGSDSD